MSRRFIPTHTVLVRVSRLHLSDVLGPSGGGTGDAGRAPRVNLSDAHYGLRRH